MIELPSPCVVVLVGPPGSGKSTWAAANVPGAVVSADALRALAGDGEADVRASDDAFRLLDDVVATRCRRGLTTVIDTLGSDAARRAQWRAIAGTAGLPCVAVVFDVSPAAARAQNRLRDKRVPEAVLRTQLTAWPSVRDAVLAEPFAAVHVVTDVAPSEATLVAPALTSPPDMAAAAPAANELRFGLQIPRYSPLGRPAELGPRVRSVSAAAEQSGFDSVWVMDHFRQIPQMGPAWEEMLESWTTLAHLAAVTERVTLGPLVAGITHRNVAQLAKIVATLDVLSGGRAVCGLGLAWFEEEHRAYGLPFPPRNERYALLEDAVGLLRAMWGPGGKPYHGPVLRMTDTSCYPRPLQARVPILIGGSGEQRTLPLAARIADAVNLFGDPDVVAAKVAVVRHAARAAGRDPTDVAISHLGTVLVGDDAAHVRALVDAHRGPRQSPERFARGVHAGTVDQHVQRVERYRQAGVDHVIVSMVGLDEESLARYGRVIQRCR